MIAVLFLITMPLIIVGLVVFTMRMSYEKYLIRTKKTFHSWIKDNDHSA